MFSKNVNLDNRKEMIDFLTKHFRYNTMNSWNHMTSYANNVKLYKLGLPDTSKAYDFLEAECEEYRLDIHDAITEFTADTGYTAEFNGRSGGYIVMHDTEVDKNGNRRTLMRGIDEYEDFEDWSIEDIRARVELIQAFDELCDNIRDIFMYYVRNSEIKNVEVITKTTKRIAEIAYA